MGARVRLWKVELQKLADETSLVLHVHHYPPGTSKWNRIEHRLFCHITQNWRGRPLTDRLAVVELIAVTTTKTGLKVESALDTRTYQKGRKVRKAEMASLRYYGANATRIESGLTQHIGDDRDNPPKPWRSVRAIRPETEARDHCLRYRPVGKAAPAPKGLPGACGRHLEAAGPRYNPEAIPTKRPVRRVKLFRQGELGRMILGALRNAVGEMPTAAIVDAVLEAGGHGEGARRAMAGRVRGNLAYLERRRVVVKSGQGRGARWALT